MPGTAGQIVPMVVHGPLQFHAVLSGGSVVVGLTRVPVREDHGAVASDPLEGTLDLQIIPSQPVRHLILVLRMRVCHKSIKR